MKSPALTDSQANLPWDQFYEVLQQIEGTPRHLGIHVLACDAKALAHSDNLVGGERTRAQSAFVSAGRRSSLQKRHSNGSRFSRVESGATRIELQLKQRTLTSDMEAKE